MKTPTHSIVINRNGTYDVALMTGQNGTEVNTTFGPYDTYQAACDAAQRDAMERSDSPAIFGAAIEGSPVTSDNIENHEHDKWADLTARDIVSLLQRSQVQQLARAEDCDDAHMERIANKCRNKAAELSYLLGRITAHKMGIRQITND